MATRKNIADAGLVTIGRISLDCERDRLHVDGYVVPLRPQSFKVLRILVENSDKLVLRDRLLKDVWQDRIVTDDSLVQCLMDIRRALAGVNDHIVLTLPGRGYLFQSDRVAQQRHRLVAFFSPRRVWVTVGIAALLLVGVFVLSFPERASVPINQPDKPSIAVLPFVDMTEKQDKRYLAEGFSEEILNRLAASDDLRVISRTSSFSFSDEATDIDTITDKLAVSHILEGSVRQGDDRLRVTVQLIDTSDDSHLWSQAYDRPFDDILDVQQDIARSVATALAATLRNRHDDATATNPYAHALVIQAKSALHLSNLEGTEHAIRLLHRALEIDPDDSTALAVLSLAVRRGGHQRGGDYVEPAWVESIAINDRALALSPSNPFAVAQRGWAELYYYKDYASAARSVERAVSLDMTDPEVMRLATNASLVFNRPDIAIRLSQYAIDRDPLCIGCQTFLIMTARVSGDLDLAEDTARNLLELDPNFSRAYAALGDVLLTKGEPAAALQAFEHLVDEGAGTLLSKAVAHHGLGQKDEFEKLRQQIIGSYAELRPAYIARLEAHAGNIDSAFYWLDKQLAKPKWARTVNYHSALYENLRGDRRWDNYLTEFGLSPVQLAQIDFSPTLPF